MKLETEFNIDAMMSHLLFMLKNMTGVAIDQVITTYLHGGNLVGYQPGGQGIPNMMSGPYMNQYGSIPMPPFFEESETQTKLREALTARLQQRLQIHAERYSGIPMHQGMFTGRSQSELCSSMTMPKIELIVQDKVKAGEEFIAAIQVDQIRFSGSGYFELEFDPRMLQLSSQADLCISVVDEKFLYVPFANLENNDRLIIPLMANKDVNGLVNITIRFMTVNIGTSRKSFQVDTLVSVRIVS